MQYFGYGSLAGVGWDGWLLALSVLLLGLFLALLVLAWWQMVRWMGYRLRPVAAARVWFVSQLGKYIPGKVVMAAGRVYLSAQEGIPVPAALLSLVLELVLMTVAGLFTYLLTWPAAGQTGPYVWISLAALPFGLAAIYPPLLEQLTNMFLRLLKKEPISLGLKYGQVLRLFLIYLVAWGVYGFSQYYLIAAFYPLPEQLFLRITGISSLSWVLGFVSFISPGGLGVREGAQALLLAQFLPAAVATVAPVLSRLLWSLAEALGIALSVAGKALRRRAKRQENLTDPG